MAARISATGMSTSKTVFTFGHDFNTLRYKFKARLDASCNEPDDAVVTLVRVPGFMITKQKQQEYM